VYVNAAVWKCRINDMKFEWISCISDHFCILEYDDIYIYRLIFQNKWHENCINLVAFQIIFVSYKILVCIYIYFSAQITWKLYELVACQIMFVSYKKWYIYIYTYLISERLITCHVLVFGYPRFVWFQGSEVPSLTRFPRWG
jgi:hypothetical protein